MSFIIIIERSNVNAFIDKLPKIYVESEKDVFFLISVKMHLRAMLLIGIVRTKRQSLGILFFSISFILQVYIMKKTMQGIVKFYNANKGFGFVTSDDGQEFFFHISEVKNHSEPQQGDPVSFQLGTNDRGECATSITLTEYPDDFFVNPLFDYANEGKPKSLTYQNRFDTPAPARRIASAPAPAPAPAYVAPQPQPQQIEIAQAATQSINESSKALNNPGTVLAMAFSSVAFVLSIVNLIILLKGN